LWRNLGFFGRGEAGQRQGLSRNIITVKIMTRQPNKALDEKDKLRPKQFYNYLKTY
jgi:hypothetical protein